MLFHYRDRDQLSVMSLGQSGLVEHTLDVNYTSDPRGACASLLFSRP
jgi:hypothetical protein